MISTFWQLKIAAVFCLIGASVALGNIHSCNKEICYAQRTVEINWSPTNYEREYVTRQDLREQTIEKNYYDLLRRSIENKSRQEISIKYREENPADPWYIDERRAQIKNREGREEQRDTMRQLNNREVRQEMRRLNNEEPKQETERRTTDREDTTRDSVHRENGRENLRRVTRGREEQRDTTRQINDREVRQEMRRLNNEEPKQETERRITDREDTTRDSVNRENERENLRRVTIGNDIVKAYFKNTHSNDFSVKTIMKREYIVIGQSMLIAFVLMKIMAVSDKDCKNGFAQNLKITLKMIGF